MKLQHDDSRSGSRNKDRIMPDVTVAAIQMDAQVGDVAANLAHATTLVEEAVARGAQLVVLPELFSTGYEYTDGNFDLPEALDGPTGTWIVDSAKRWGVHLVGSFPARIESEAYIVAMLASPSGEQWVYRKMHVAMWENCYFDRGTDPVVADTDLGRIGLLVCWDQVFADLARAYQERVDLLCIPSSPPTWVGTMEDDQGHVLARLDELRSLGNRLDGAGWFARAQVAHARCAGVPVIHAARCGTFHSSIPYGSSFLTMLSPRDALRVLRAVGTRYWLRCPMMGCSCIRDRTGEPMASTGQDSEAVLVAEVQPGAADLAPLPPVPTGRSLVPEIPRVQFLFDDSMIVQGRWYRQRHRQRMGPTL
jgi:predicted amidohydrolase